MLEIEMPESRMLDLTLEPDRLTKGPGADPLNGWFALGVPLCIPLTTDRVKEDRDLLQFVEANSDKSCFDLIRFACTFSPIGDEIITEAWFMVNLDRADGIKGDGSPIAWSMEPRSLTDSKAISQNVSIGPKLKLTAGIVSGELSGEVGRKADYNIEMPYVTACNEQRSDPYWEFKTNASRQIRGPYRLTLIVQRPKGVVIRGVMNVNASVERKRFGIIPYTVKPSQPELQTFDIA